MKNAIYRLCLLAIASTLVPSARADLNSYFVRSLEWLTDSSDVIVIVEITQSSSHKIATTQTVIKGPAQSRLQGWPHSALATFVAELPRGRRLLVFGRLGKGGTPQVVDLICLGEDRKPLSGDALEAARYVAVTGTLKAKAKQGVCAALTKHGDLLINQDQVLRLVHQRLAQGSRVPPDCNRERVELSYSYDDYGGVYHSPGTLFDSNEAIHHVLVPWEPEYEKALLEELARGSGSAKVGAARQLANYRTPAAIAALQACLNDSLVVMAEKDGSQVLLYAVRVTAYQSLCRLGVDVPEPNLRPPGHRWVLWW
jgi:hypothetical protein